MNLSLKQLTLLDTIFKKFSISYPDLTLNEFVLKCTNKNIAELTHKTLSLLINKVNNGWDLESSYCFLKPNFDKLKYVIETETDDYIIGTQYHYTTYLKELLKNKLKIFAFKNLMILDYDIKDESKEELLHHITTILSDTNFTYLIYETTNGYHAYNISKSYPYYKKETQEIMMELKCDNWYINFTKYIGFVTRLQKKTNRNELFIEKFVKQINNYPIDLTLKKLVGFKDSLIKDIII